MKNQDPLLSSCVVSYPNEDWFALIDTVELKIMNDFGGSLYVAMSGNVFIGWLGNKNEVGDNRAQHFLFGRYSLTKHEIFGRIVGKGTYNYGYFLGVPFSKK